jgi:predicted RNase H-like HicB family nuclease
MGRRLTTKMDLLVTVVPGAMNHTLRVIIEHDKDGYFAYVPELKGRHTQGATVHEVMKDIKEAMELYGSTT